MYKNTIRQPACKMPHILLTEYSDCTYLIGIIYIFTTKFTQSKAKITC